MLIVYISIDRTANKLREGEQAAPPPPIPCVSHNIEFKSSISLTPTAYLLLVGMLKLSSVSSRTCNNTIHLCSPYSLRSIKIIILILWAR